MSRSRLIRMLFSLLIAPVFCCAFGCKSTASSVVVENPDMIVLVSRSLDTGRFDPFVIKDQAFVEGVRKAVLEDLKRPDKRSRLGLGMSVNHVLVFRGKDGEISSLEILGNDFIVVDSTRYPALRTIEVLKNARAAGAAEAISVEEATRLVPSLDSYLR